MKSAQKFWDKAAARYARSPVKDEASYQKKLAITRDYFQPDSLSVFIVARKPALLFRQFSFPSRKNDGATPVQRLKARRKLAVSP